MPNLISDVDVKVSPLLLLLSHLLFSPAEGILIHLCLNLLGRVAHIDGRRRVGCAHLRLGPRESGKKLAVKQRWFLPAYPGCHIPRLRVGSARDENSVSNNLLQPILGVFPISLACDQHERGAAHPPSQFPYPPSKAMTMTQHAEVECVCEVAVDRNV